ncbi:uncharacterized protein LOC124483727 [Hypomesus transpacificus]|uniref:uncharacterized protein LOC124483727 n=1 Tax=Hypomesus transpacificus TaxID=137520 RepID=UPI001F07C633|nr:uncharacterized protein LOC124483727 [Hypomesus transpacificus]
MDTAEEIASTNTGNGSEGMQKQTAADMEKLRREKLRAEKGSKNPEKENAEAMGSGAHEEETVTVGSEPSYSKALTVLVELAGLPVYITDLEILKKLLDWGVRAISPITRRMWPGTRIVEGTRFVKVKFTDTVKSLPYSTRFDTEMGAQYFRVIHDRQVKVCRMCIQPGHIVRECPEFLCRNCGRQGHYARECDRWEPKCKECGEKESNCVCKGGEGEEEESALSIDEDSESEDVGGEGVEGKMEEGFVVEQLRGGLGTSSSPVVVDQTGESVGGGIGSSLDSNMVALTDPANGSLGNGKAKVDAWATGGKGSEQGPLPSRVVRTNADRSAAMEFERQQAVTTESVSGRQEEVPASDPPTMSEGDESEGDCLSVAGGRKRALLNRSGKLAGIRKQNQKKKGKKK